MKCGRQIYALVAKAKEIKMSRPPVASMSLSRAKQGAERKRRGKAMPILGAAGLSLTLASGASAATEAPAADVLTHNAGVSHEITLSEEEISDVSLATFYVFDKESARPPRHSVRLAWGAYGCWTGTYYTSPVFGNDAYPLPPRPVRPAHARAPKHVPKSP
jgi:hypothetical protein